MGDYLHGYTDEEADRLLRQAEFLAPWVLDPLDLSDLNRVLEVGVGVGAETRLLRKRWPQLEIVGVDLEMGSLGRARQVLGGDQQVALVRASGSRLPLADASFDGVLLIWVLEHVPDPLALLEECARVMRPGGRLIATEVYNRSLLVEPRHPIIEEYFDALSETQRRAGGHPDIAARLPSLATDAGLQVTRYEWFPVLADSRDRARAVELVRYFEGLCRSAEPLIRGSGVFPAERLPAVWAAFDAVCDAPEPLLCYVGGRLEATRIG